MKINSGIVGLRNPWRSGAVLLLLVLSALLWRQARQRPRFLTGLGGNATAIAFSPDGQTIVCASSNNYVQKWMPNIQKWRSFSNPNNYMTNLPPQFQRLRFSSDGQLLYAGGSQLNPSYSSVGHAWNMATRRHSFGFNYLKSPAFDVSRDGHWAAMGYQDDVMLVDLTGKPAKRPKDDSYLPKDFQLLPMRTLKVNGSVNCVAFSSDSKTLVVGDANFSWSTAFWNVASATNLRAAPSVVGAPVSTGAPVFVEWSPDGQSVAAADATGLTIFHRSDASLIQAAWPAPTNASTVFNFTVPLAWSPDGQWLFSGGQQVLEWRASDLKMRRTFGVSGGVAVSPDGKILATNGYDDPEQPHSVLLWNID